MRVYNLEGIDMIHISEFAELTHRSIQSTRRLIENGNSIRKLKSFRDRSRLMIPVVELTGFPFTAQGTAVNSKEIFHYYEEDGNMTKKVCEVCSYTDQQCDCRKAAEALLVPEGDK